MVEFSFSVHGRSLPVRRERLASLLSLFEHSTLRLEFSYEFWTRFQVQGIFWNEVSVSTFFYLSFLRKVRPIGSSAMNFRKV